MKKQNKKERPGAQPVAATELQSMLVENRRRNTRPHADPLTGEGMPGGRKEVEIDGLAAWKKHNLPEEMLCEKLVELLVKFGSVDKYLKDLDIRPTDDERRRIIDQWERLRSRYDFYFWAARFVKIKSKEGDIVAFRLNAPQRKLVDAFERMRLGGRPIRMILLKARQWGGSTATQLYMAWIQLVHKIGWNSLIVGHQSSASAEVNSMFELMMEHYPIEMLVEPGATIAPKTPKVSNLHGTTSTRVVQLRNAKIKLGTAERPQSVRGGDSSMVHCTEVAYWKKTEGRTPTQMMKSATSGVLFKPLTMIVYESSANGVGNFFHSEYEAAKEGFSQFESMFVAWYEIEQYRLEFTEANAPKRTVKGAPRFATAEELARWMLLNRYEGDALSERTVPGRYLWRLWESGATLEAINWYVAERTKYIDHADMASEFPSNDIEAFAHSGARVFPLERLAQMRGGCSAPRHEGDVAARAESGVEALSDVAFDFYEGGRLKVWSMPGEGPDVGSVRDRYVVTVDIGGRSPRSDWSVIHVLDRAPMVYGLPMETVAQWRGHIDMDLLAWKSAQIATLYDNALLVIESNTIESSDSERFVDGDQSPYLFTVLDRSYPNLYYRNSGKPGFHTNVSTKPVVISALVQAVREGTLLERDEACVDELCCYERRQDGSFGAISGKHDDMLMTRAIGVHVATNELPVLSTAADAASRRRVSGAYFDNF